VGRAPAFWTDNTTRLIRDYFVAVSLSDFDQGRQDAVGRFLRRAGIRLEHANGNRWCVTAGGRVLAADPLQAWHQFQALPAAERLPGAVQVEDMGPVDTARTAASPPPGGLILKVYYRAFMHDVAGDLRYVTGWDLWHDEKGTNPEAYPGIRLDLNVTRQAQPDHLWLSREECQALMPPAPRRGDTVAIPRSIEDRLFRWHLNPLQVYGEANPLSAEQVRAGALKLTVTTVRPERVRLWLEGFARLGQEITPEIRTSRKAWLKGWGYEPRVLGQLEYDPRTRTFGRFDVIALGEHFGRLGALESAARCGCQPLGISFELVRGDQPADRVAPGRTPSSRQYFSQAPRP
jgi:hypothetical protein